MIDRDSLAKSLGFERSDVDMILNMFKKNAETSLEKMKISIKDKNLKSIQDEAHAIKGSAGNLMLTEIFTLSKQIEHSTEFEEGLLIENYEVLKGYIEQV